MLRRLRQLAVALPQAAQAGFVAIQLMGAFASVYALLQGFIWLLIVGVLLFLISGITSIIFRPITLRRTFYTWYCNEFGAAKDIYNRTLELKFCQDPQTRKLYGFGISTSSILLRATSQDLGEMEYRYRTPEYPGDASKFIHVALGQFTHAKYKVTLEKARADNTTVYYAIKIVPYLSRSESITIPLIVNSPPGTFLPIRAPDRDFEYSMITVVFPSNQITQRVIFPHLYEVPVDLAVWFGGGRVLHQRETAKLKEEKSLTLQRDAHGRLIAEMTVAFPIPGLVYAVTWKLPETCDTNLETIKPPSKWQFPSSVANIQ